MKKFLLILQFALFYSISNGQPPPAGSYITNNEVNKLEGTWKWVSGTDEVILKLKKFRTTITDYDEDVILGSHSYIKNGVIIENSLGDFEDIPINQKLRTVFIYLVTSTDPNKFQGSLKDISKHKRIEMHIIYTPGSPPTISLRLTQPELTSLDPNFQYGITLPADIILTKQ
jgi:hypothetical protein